MSTMILGIDEVGRGPWAGPLVVGAVVLGSVTIDGLTDSKKLSKKRRDQLAAIIQRDASGCALGWVDAIEIDSIGLAAALRLATIRAVEQITVPYHEIIIDGTVNFLKDTSKGPYVTTLKKADLLIPSVSAASIIAKVARDNYMAAQDERYPQYGFSRHVGYGTAFHQQALRIHGPTPLHRLSFKPLQASDVSHPAEIISTTSIGNRAESMVAEHLERRGHIVLERNWKTKYCEVDIVSMYRDVLYFTEVKYRKTTHQGGGLAAITQKKRRQMAFAAEYYALTHRLLDKDRRLTAASVVGEEFTIDSFIELD